MEKRIKGKDQGDELRLIEKEVNLKEIAERLRKVKSKLLMLGMTFRLKQAEEIKSAMDELEKIAKEIE